MVKLWETKLCSFKILTLRLSLPLENEELGYGGVYYTALLGIPPICSCVQQKSGKGRRGQRACLCANMLQWKIKENIRNPIRNAKRCSVGKRRTHKVRVVFLTQGLTCVRLEGSTSKEREAEEWQHCVGSKKDCWRLVFCVVLIITVFLQWNTVSGRISVWKKVIQSTFLKIKEHGACTGSVLWQMADGWVLAE